MWHWDCMWCIVPRNIPSQHTMLILLATTRTWNICDIQHQFFLDCLALKMEALWSLKSEELHAHWLCYILKTCVFVFTTVRTSNCASVLDGSLNFETLWDYRLTLKFHRNLLSPSSCRSLIDASHSCSGHVKEFLLKTMELVRDLERVDKLHKCFNWRPNLPFIMIRNLRGLIYHTCLYKNILHITKASGCFELEYSC